MAIRLDRGLDMENRPMTNEATTQETLEQARMLHGIIRKLQRKVGSRMMSAANLPDLELTVAQLNVMMVVHAQQPITVKALAEELGVSAASASGMVDRLVELGALRREQSTVDRRQVAITVSEAAAASIVQCEEHILGFLSEMLERIGPELAQQWCAVYGRVSEILDEDPDMLEQVESGKARNSGAAGARHETKSVSSR
jgi:DNA-binding MarR family transcriptional regulator